MKLHNRTKEPLFLHQIMVNATLDDGIHTSYVAGPSEYERAFMGYPEISALNGKPLASELTVDGGQTVEGDILASFRLTRQEWEARKGLDFTFGFRYQPVLKVTPASPVTDQ